MLVGQKEKDYLAESHPLTAQEFEAVIYGTNLLIKQVTEQHPLVPFKELLGGVGVPMPLGEMLRIRGVLRKYREMLLALQEKANTVLSEEERAALDELLFPERAKPKLVQASAGDLPPVSIEDLLAGRRG